MTSDGTHFYDFSTGHRIAKNNRLTHLGGVGGRFAQVGGFSPTWFTCKKFHCGRLYKNGMSENWQLYQYFSYLPLNKFSDGADTTCRGVLAVNSTRSICCCCRNTVCLRPVKKTYFHILSQSIDSRMNATVDFGVYDFTF